MSKYSDGVSNETNYIGIDGSNMRRREFVGVVAAGAMACAGGIAALSPAFGDEATADGASDGANEQSETDTSEMEALKEGRFATPCVQTRETRRQESKRVLVVVDYQVDFVSGGVFGDIEPAMHIEDALYDSIKDYQDNGDIVIYTMDTHPLDNYELTREGQYNPPHCIPGTEGWEIYGKVKELLTPEKAILLMKGTYGSRDLPGVIQQIKDQGIYIESIEIAGVSTTCRVLHNAILIYNFFPETMLIMDCQTTASYTYERTLDQLKELEGWGFCIKW